MEPIDLGVSYDEIVPPVKEMKQEAHYPTLHIESNKKIDFPEEGVMTIHFRKTGFSVSDRNGGKHYSCTIEAREILDIEAKDYDESPTKSSSRKSEDALDELMAEVIGRKSKSEAY